MANDNDHIARVRDCFGSKIMDWRASQALEKEAESLRKTRPQALQPQRAIALGNAPRDLPPLSLVVQTSRLAGASRRIQCKPSSSATSSRSCIPACLLVSSATIQT